MRLKYSRATSFKAGRVTRCTPLGCSAFVGGAHGVTRPASCYCAAFTMVEIAICLAIIGFALVAIIGVLPSGMRVQKDNSEETIINQDATYWLESIRSGAKGADLLTNYVEYIKVITANLSRGGPPTVTYYSNMWLTPISIPGNPPVRPLISGQHIVGLLSTPRYEEVPLGLVVELRSNYVSAVVRSISGPAVDKGVNFSSRDFAFHYRLVPEVVPANWTALRNFNWNVQGRSPQELEQLTNQWNVLRTTAENLHEVRLLFRWPVLKGIDPQSPTEPRIGPGRQMYRTLVSGSLDRLVLPDGQRSITNYFFQPTIHRVANIP